MLGTEYLGLSEREWGRLTPRLLMARVAHRRESEKARERRLDLRAGLIAAELRNTVGFKRNGEPWGPYDFFPEPQPPQTDDDMLRAMDLWWALSTKASEVTQ